MRRRCPLKEPCTHRVVSAPKAAARHVCCNGVHNRWCVCVIAIGGALLRCVASVWEQLCRGVQTCEGPCREGVLRIEWGGSGLLVQLGGEGSKFFGKAGGGMVALEDVSEAVGVKRSLVDAGSGGQQGALFNRLW